MSAKTPGTHISQAIVTGFYSGYSPIMPGTAGTLVAAIIFYLLSALQENLVATIPNNTALILFIFSLVVGTPVLHSLLGKDILSSDDDPQEVVIDEFAGYYLTILWFAPTLSNITLAFFLFRLFDMTKPPPIKQLEKLPGAIGIMVDDLGAAIPSILFLLAINKYLL